MNLLHELEGLAPDLEKGLAQACSLSDLEELRVVFLGRKGKLASIMSQLPSLDAAERPAFGKKANEIKDRLIELFEARKNDLEGAAAASELAGFDPSLPGRQPWQGSLHPITRVMNEVCVLFAELGYEIVVGPEVEHDYYNFEALNIPPDHPARDMQDTLYVNEGIVMRTHTSPVEVRTMLASKKPPVAVVIPGKVYRRDSDITHSPMFHQIEGLIVGKGINLCDLRGTLAYMCRSLFGQTVKVRFRPSFFPFTEPSAEVDISCIMCNGKGHINHQPCRVCKTTGWLEILGCGMTDPNVYAFSGFSKECTGFAYGLGVERVAMLKYGIGDLRLFFENDMRFLQQFS